MKTDEDFDFEICRQEQNKPGEWVVIAPITGIKLTSATNNELRIKNVLIVSKSKLPRIRKRIGLPTRISNIGVNYKIIFESAESCAITWYSGTPDQVRIKCRKTIRDTLSILSVSQLGYSKRRYGSCPSIKGEVQSGVVGEILINKHDTRRLSQERLIGKYRNLIFDKRWKEFQKKIFFFPLLKILNKETQVKDSWREELERASILVGQSQCSNDIAQSFLWNMIALELLLTRRGDKYSDVLPKRIESFLGWAGFWEVDGYSEKIKNVYGKRCSFVHDGKRDSITIQDLLFTDDLLLNLFSNLVLHPTLFNSKEQVIAFSKKVEAEHILKIRPTVRPKTLRSFSRNYTEEDYQEI